MMELSVVFKYLLVVAAFTILALGIVLGKGTITQKVNEAKSVILRYSAYAVLDFGLMGLSIALVAVMKSIEANIYVTTVSMWIFDYVTAWSLLYLCLKTGEDLTLGRQYRKGYDLIKSKSPFSGIISLTVLTTKGIIWDGPEKFVEFWHIEINSNKSRLLVLLIGSLVQAIFWTTLYWFGFELI